MLFANVNGLINLLRRFKQHLTCEGDFTLSFSTNLNSFLLYEKFSQSNYGMKPLNMEINLIHRRRASVMEKKLEKVYLKLGIES